MKLLSDLSGGKYFDNVEYYEVIAEEIQNTTGNYYILGYYIGEQWDGKYHTIEVEVTRKGCQVYAQGGYFNPKLFKKYSKFEKQLHLIDLAFAENPKFQDPLNFPLITLPCSDRDRSNVVTLAEIPIEKIKEVVEGETEPWRTFNMSPIHISGSGADLNYLDDIGWRTMWFRGNEWAATGEIIYPVPDIPNAVE